MTENRFKLEKYKGINSRYDCPKCKKSKIFSLYIDTETGNHINHTVGRCNREVNCGYHYTPKEYYRDNNMNEIQKPYNSPKIVIPINKQISLIPTDVFMASIKNYEANNFTNYLINLFGINITNELVGKYFIGTSGLWNGSTVFWQIDTQGKIRTGKIMLYNENTGKRVKEPINCINWIHTLLKQPEFELKQCLFGEHLLKKDNIKPVAIVESEKTAIIASVYLPKFIWLATGGLSNLNADNSKILKGRKVVFFPDLNGFDKWSNKVKELYYITNFTISDLLERKATEEEKMQGLDLADYLIKFDYREFIKQEQILITQKQNNITSKSIKCYNTNQVQNTNENKYIIPKVKPSNNPYKPTNINDVDLTIIEHYLSFNAPYDVNDFNDLKSLVEGLKNETGLIVEQEYYQLGVTKLLN